MRSTMLRSFVRWTAAFGAAVVVALFVGVVAACPPPPPVEEPDAGFPDAGTVAAAGDECFSATTGITNACDLGLVCATLLNAADGTFACAAPAQLGEECFFNNLDEAAGDAPEDGCANGLACGGRDVCVPRGGLDAPCASPVDCESLACGSLADGSSGVCVVNECIGGCPQGSSCQQRGACGLFCAVSPVEGEACFVDGADACSPLRTPCAVPLECFVGNATNTTCGTPGGNNAQCNLETIDDGCALEFSCDADGRCSERNEEP